MLFHAKGALELVESLGSEDGKEETRLIAFHFCSFDRSHLQTMQNSKL